MADDGLAIIIEGRRGDWPGGTRTLTPRAPGREPNGTFWFGAELNPDGDQVWFRIMPSVLRGCVRAPPRAPRVGQGVRPPCSRCRCRSRPAIGVRFTEARASRCRADAKTGSQPAARSAASTAASRPIPDGISRRAMPALGPAHGPGSPTRR